MKIYITAIYLIGLLALQGCGGATAESTTPSYSIVPMERNTVGLSIQRPSTAADGYSGGLNVFRDTTGLSGGTKSHVNTAVVSRTVAGEGVLQFEWTNLAIMDNYALAGENVAVYAQGNKYGGGPTWAAVSEVSDYSQVQGTVVAHEFDLGVMGPDNGSRIGLDVIVMDSAKRAGGVSSEAVGSVGVRIGGTLPAQWTRGIHLIGTYKVGIDLADAKTLIPIRLGEGQSISFDANDRMRLQYSGGKFHLMNNQTSVYSIDMTNGDTYKYNTKQ